jgi:cysteine desulfurase
MRRVMIIQSHTLLPKSAFDVPNHGHDRIVSMPDMHVYLDHAATTPMDPGVIDVMLPHLSDTFGNPSSVHRWGQQADAIVETSRRGIASLMGCSAEEIVFTACGSESDNLALRGAAFAARSNRGATRILTTPVDHPAVLRTAEQLASQFGFRLEMVPVDEHGLVSADTLAARLDEDVALVSIIYANNEIGTINPIPALAQVCRMRSIPFHTDAVQAASQLPIDVDALGVDLMSIGAHKFYGPKGIGALYVRKGTAITPTLTGGSQEQGLRAGTENTPLIVGIHEALRITADRRDSDNPRFAGFRDQIISSVLEMIPDSRLTGHPSNRLPNHASFVFQGIEGNQLLASLDLAGFACSSGSACKSGDPQPSRVLHALGIDDQWIMGSLRVSIGRSTTSDQVHRFIESLPGIVERLRAPGIS